MTDKTQLESRQRQLQGLKTINSQRLTLWYKWDNKMTNMADMLNVVPSISSFFFSFKERILISSPTWHSDCAIFFPRTWSSICVSSLIIISWNVRSDNYLLKMVKHRCCVYIINILWHWKELYGWSTKLTISTKEIYRNIPPATAKIHSWDSVFSARRMPTMVPR